MYLNALQRVCKRDSKAAITSKQTVSASCLGAGPSARWFGHPGGSNHMDLHVSLVTDFYAIDDENVIIILYHMEFPASVSGIDAAVMG